MPFFTNRGIIPLPAGGGGGDYEGPFEIHGAALVWWGMRAYSADTRGDPAIRLKRASDTTQQDILTDATTGELDMSDGSFFTGGPYYVMKFYDQTGGGNDWVVGTPNEAAWVLTLDAGLPCVENTGGGTGPVSEANVTSTQPFTISMVTRAATGITQTPVISDTTTNFQAGHSPSNAADLVFMYGGAVVSAAADDDAFHALQFAVNGSSSAICVDGSTTGSLNPSTLDLAGQLFATGGDASLKIREVGAWTGDKSSNFAAINTNQTDFWTDI